MDNINKEEIENIYDKYNESIFVGAYRILGFRTTNSLPTYGVTDEEIRQHYEEVKKRIENKITTKKLQTYLDGIEEAYTLLSTEENRAEYEKNINHRNNYEKAKRTPLGRFIIQSGEDPTQNPSERKMLKGNKAYNITRRLINNDNRLIYDDNSDNVSLEKISDINFLNGVNMQDQIGEYVLKIKEDEDITEYPFYSRVTSTDMNYNDEYRNTLYKAVYNISGSKYIGSVCKDEKTGEYYMLLDDGEKDAAKYIEEEKNIENKNEER